MEEKHKYVFDSHAQRWVEDMQKQAEPMTDTRTTGGRAMKWTKERPTESGWYWFRDTTFGVTSVLEVKIHRDKSIRIGPCYDGEITRGEWAGPIPEPEEP